MGILLPPVSQVTTKITSHHRNRSLDSALQRIPEVDVTPSPECETVLSNPLSSESTVKSTPNKEDLTSIGSDDSGIVCRYDTLHYCASSSEHFTDNYLNNV